MSDQEKLATIRAFYHGNDESLKMLQRYALQAVRDIKFLLYLLEQESPEVQRAAKDQVEETGMLEGFEDLAADFCAKGHYEQAMDVLKVVCKHRGITTPEDVEAYFANDRNTRTP